MNHNYYGWNKELFKCSVNYTPSLLILWSSFEHYGMNIGNDETRKKKTRMQNVSIMHTYVYYF